MRVLVVHNRYSSRVPSGENLAVDDEVRWLRDAGVDVVRHEVTNDDLIAPGAAGRIRGGLESMWSRRSADRFLQALDDHRPDVVHVHNLFPLLTGSVPASATRRQVPVVWTVHNRRVRCVSGGHFRDGDACHDCRPGWRLPGIVHGCYSQSRLASTTVTIGSTIFRNVARRRGVTPIAISNAVADWLVVGGGFDRSSVRVKYNGVAGPTTSVPPAEQQSSFVFLGRLAEHKGVGLLLDAWRLAGVDAQLHIVGEGDMRDAVRDAADADPTITWGGPVGAEDVSSTIAAARAVVVPSVYEEPFGRVAAEALAHGRPVITTGRGGLSEIVDETCGWRTGTDAPSIADALRQAASSDDAVVTRAHAARRRHLETFSPEATTAALVELYADSCARTASQGSR
jgi:glycosyltransferase involved in cell wall biosynthesis